MATVAILGGGMAGLTAAFQLQRRGHAPTVFEAATRAGGAVRTEHADGFVVEYGPHSLRTRTRLLNELISALGLEDEVIVASAAAPNRYIVRDGRLVALPSRPPEIFRSPFLSWRGKLRLLREPFVRAAPPEAGEESVAAFVRRRLGQETLDYAANPFVAGIFAGDPAQLSVQHAFPRLAELEQTHGSLLKGLAKLARATQEAGTATGVFSFRAGMQTLPDALATTLGPRLRLGTRVTGFEKTQNGWQIQHDGGPVGAPFDAVVSTLPLPRFVELDFQTTVDRSPLAGVDYPPVGVVALGFRRDDVGHSLDGFGALVPEVERAFRILGVIFVSSLFPHRAPPRHVLLTALVGGARHPALLEQSDDALQDLVLADLEKLLNVRAAPVFARHYRWPRAIPQYTLGYGTVKATLDALEAEHPGLFFAGNYRQGISVADAMASAEAVVERIATGG